MPQRYHGIFHTVNPGEFNLVLIIELGNEQGLLGIWLEGLLYGKLCILTSTLDKDVQLFSGPGLYSGIFAMYLQYQWESKKGTKILFYAVCLLYALGTATIVTDMVTFIVFVSNNSICKKKKKLFF